MKTPTTLALDAFQHLKSHFYLLAGVYVIPGIVTLTLALFVVDEQFLATVDRQGIALALILFAVIIILNILMGVAMVRAVSAPEENDLVSAYRFAVKNLIPYAIVGLMVSVIVMVGFVLLIIPGIIFMVWYAFSYFTLLLEGKRGYGALKQSREYVRGRWWAVFGRMLFLLLIAVALGLIVGIVMTLFGFKEGSVGNDLIAFLLNIFLVPFSISYMYFLYRSTKDAALAEQAPAGETPPEPQREEASQIGHANTERPTQAP